MFCYCSSSPVQFGTLPGGRELISRVTSDLATGPSFWGDATGVFELRERTYNAAGPISSNNFALVQTAALREGSKRGAGQGPQEHEQEQASLNGLAARHRAAGGRALAVLTSRTMGVASLRPGELECMLQRRIEQGSDFQGPAPLGDTGGVVDTLRLLAGAGALVKVSRPLRALELENPLVVFYASDAMGDLALRSWAPVALAGDRLLVGFFVRHSPDADTTATAATSFTAQGGNGGGDDVVEYALRLQNLSPAPRVVTLGGLFPGPSFASCTEMTLTSIAKC